jgi:hypothetical protein
MPWLETEQMHPLASDLQEVGKLSRTTLPRLRNDNDIASPTNLDSGGLGVWRHDFDLVLSDTPLPRRE